MMKSIFCILFVFSAFTVFSQTNIQPLKIGEIRTINSKVLNEKRTLNIYLPPKFDKTKSYPVIYLLDGSMDEDFLHITGLVQFFNYPERIFYFYQLKDEEFNLWVSP